MRRYALMVMLAAVAACVDADPDPLEDGARRFTVHWWFVTDAGQLKSCPTGFGTVEAVAVYVRSGERVVGTFPCVDGKGEVTVPLVQQDSAGVMIRLRKGPGGTMFGESNIVAAPESGEVDVVVITDLGRLQIHWALTRNGAPATCQDVGVEAVEYIVTPVRGASISGTTNCVFGQAATGFLATGAARIAITAGNGTAQVVSETLPDVAVPAGGLLFDTPVITLAFP